MNPIKRFFLSLSADSLLEVNNMRDKNDISCSSKSMMRTGMSFCVSI